jgi:6-phosphogluconate dehydrogenase
MTDAKAEIGMVGLGVMGRNLLLNMADHGFTVAGYDKDPAAVKELRAEAGERKVVGWEKVEDFVGGIREPRAVMMLVPAGPIVDSVINDLLPHLNEGDLIIDAGNSHFTDTDVRQKAMEARGLHFFGMGVSGGEAGARHGPSMMPGGPPQAYERVRKILEASAAQVDSEPCVTYLGPRSAGHYVKMVHNGIEYGLMQLIAEAYDLMRRGLELTDDELSAVFERWNQGKLNGYLIEITAEIFRQVDEKTGKRLVDVILDAAKQKGTGMWTSQDALQLLVPTPTIDVAVSMRNLSAMEQERLAIQQAIPDPDPRFEGDKSAFIEQLRRALYAAFILTYAQGMAQLQTASQAYAYDLDLGAIARIWRGGCIIRSALLEPIRAAFSRRPDLPHLVGDEALGKAVAEGAPDLRAVVQVAGRLQIPAPALMVSLGYLDGLRAERLPANLIQAQRDFFGAHTYERVDARGVFHTRWSQDEDPK